MKRELKSEEREEIVSAIAASDRVKATSIYLSATKGNLTDAQNYVKTRTAKAEALRHAVTHSKLRDAFVRLAVGRKGLLSVWAAIVLVAPSALPTAARAQSGIAARYPGDKNIASDPAVILADDFESYTSPTQLTTKWTGAYQLPNLRIATEAGNYFSGGKALEMSLPISTTEVSNTIRKALNPTQDVVFIRIYQKWDAGYSLNNTSNHNGVRLSAKYPGPGIMPPVDGTGFYSFTLQNHIEGTAMTGETTPGYGHIYAYWPKQRTQTTEIIGIRPAW